MGGARKALAVKAEMRAVARQIPQTRHIRRWLPKRRRKVCRQGLPLWVNQKMLVDVDLIRTENVGLYLINDDICLTENVSSENVQRQLVENATCTVVHDLEMHVLSLSKAKDRCLLRLTVDAERVAPLNFHSSLLGGSFPRSKSTVVLHQCSYVEAWERPMLRRPACNPGCGSKAR